MMRKKECIISDDFKTPEVIQMFDRKEQPQLKQRLAEV